MFRQHLELKKEREKIQIHIKKEMRFIKYVLNILIWTQTNYNDNYTSGFVFF